MAGPGSASADPGSASETLPELRASTTKVVPEERKAAWKADIHKALRWAEEWDAAERFEKCGEKVKLVCINCGAQKKAAQYCMQRFCVDCSRRQADELRRRVMKAIRAMPYRRGWCLKMITLTIKTPDGAIPETIEKMEGAVKKLNRRILWRDEFGRKWRDVRKRNKNEKSCSGYTLAIELGPKRGNVHAHLLYYGPYIPHQELTSVWRSLVGEGFVWIEKSRSIKAAVREGLKYLTDLQKLSATEVVAMYQLFKGKRRIRTYGCFRGLEMEEPQPSKCPHCGGEEWCTEEGLQFLLRSAVPLVELDIGPLEKPSPGSGVQQVPLFEAEGDE